MVAVSAFLGNRPRVPTAIGFGVRWGLGHAAVVLAVGAIVAAAGVAIPDRLSHWAELGVGVTLIGLGMWAGQAARRFHFHAPKDHGGHAHLHAHDVSGHPHRHRNDEANRRHRHFSTLVGAAHGLAGTATAVALIPVTLIAEFWAAVGYLLAFGVGTVGGMALFAALGALAIERVQSVHLARRVAVGIALVTALVGLWWCWRALAALVRG